MKKYDDLETREFHWNQSLEEFETNIGASLPEVESSWTFSMALLYAGTIYTTIGKNNLSPSI
ncbi:unnamed protein product [Enterobius vermicularis]|uniref:Ion_trans_2 domain-containing protein n=1 Tax=Enterobius vermicularis TaxID=51028 RepID=A0A0N4V5D9_ENTVE|nr:unnamed protein product [Enterobius vermicularis]